MNSNSSLISDEYRWVSQIRQQIDEDIEEDIEIPVSIFNVPPVLHCIKPECYIPQQVALGPYHHWRPELYEMERYKLSAAQRSRKQLRATLKFQDLVDHLAVSEPKIRACYHKYLDFNGETLAWMMAVDVSFLLEFLHVYAIEGRVLRRVTSRMSHLVGFSGSRKFANDAILRDMVMLENQIPIFLLKKVLEFQFSSLELADKTLSSMLLGLYNELSPFKIVEQSPNLRFTDCIHVLDFLYHMIVPNAKEQYSVITEADNQDDVEGGQQRLKQMIVGLGDHLKRMIFSEPVKLIIKFPWTIISNLPLFRILKQALEQIRSSQDKELLLPECNNKPPLMEEISIPSVTDLAKAGVRFSPSGGGILTIDFDKNASRFFLPVVSLDVNTEVVLRNLVAYEACNASGPLVFTRYTELMNGIIDTEEDAKLLRERGVIINRLKSDEAVANLWNGMSSSVRLTKVPFLDKIIEDVNNHYKGRWSVKIARFMNVYVFSSWQSLAFLAAILLLVLMSLQVISSFSRCALMVLLRNV